MEFIVFLRGLIPRRKVLGFIFCLKWVGKKNREWTKGAIPEGERDRIRRSARPVELIGGRHIADEITLKIERRIELRG